jgi:ribosomal protein S27AE
MVEDGYDEPLPYIDAAATRAQADAAIDDIMAPVDVSGLNEHEQWMATTHRRLCPKCGKPKHDPLKPQAAIDAVCVPSINSLYGHDPAISDPKKKLWEPLGELKGWLIEKLFCRRGVANSKSWSIGHKWRFSGIETHYDSSETWQFTCQRCGRVGHGGL